MSCATIVHACIILEMLTVAMAGALVMCGACTLLMLIMICVALALTLALALARLLRLPLPVTVTPRRVLVFALPCV